jgi:hypothetical protein
MFRRLFTLPQLVARAVNEENLKTQATPFTVNSWHEGIASLTLFRQFACLLHCRTWY